MIQRDIKSYAIMFQETGIVWSDVLPRAGYRGARFNVKVENPRKSLNYAMKHYMPQFNGQVIHHHNIQWNARHLYRRDGVHLNNMGNDVLLANITDAMAKLFP